MAAPTCPSIKFSLMSSISNLGPNVPNSAITARGKSLDRANLRDLKLSKCKRVLVKILMLLVRSTSEKSREVIRVFCKDSIIASIDDDVNVLFAILRLRRYLQFEMQVATCFAMPKLRLGSFGSTKFSVRLVKVVGMLAGNEAEVIVKACKALGNMQVGVIFECMFKWRNGMESKILT